MTYVHHTIRIALGFGILLVMLWIGNWATKWVPVPGSLIGMVLLACFLAVNQGVLARAVTACGEIMLRYFAFFFVPAGVGVMVHLHELRANWFAVVVSLVVSSLLSLVGAALTMNVLMKRNRTGTNLEQGTSHG
jgi:holin-like protein